MKNIRTTVTASLAAATLTGVGLLGATATAAPDTETEPCSAEAAKVEKAQAALDRVTANFERQQAKVKKAKGEVKKAEKRSEKAAAREELREAKEKKGKAADAKRAQQQRLAKATERYDACMAEPVEEPPVEETPAP